MLQVALADIRLDKLKEERKKKRKKTKKRKKNVMACQSFVTTYLLIADAITFILTETVRRISKC